jgi:hypothetical protein
MATRANDAIVAETASAGQRRGGQELCEDEDWLRDVANEMEIGDGVIRVYGVGEDGVQAFTDFGIANLTELVRKYKENPAWLKRWRPNNPISPRPTPDGYREGHSLARLPRLAYTKRRLE